MNVTGQLNWVTSCQDTEIENKIEITKWNLLEKKTYYILFHPLEKIQTGCVKYTHRLLWHRSQRSASAGSSTRKQTMEGRRVHKLNSGMNIRQTENVNLFNSWCWILFSLIIFSLEISILTFICQKFIRKWQDLTLCLGSCLADPKRNQDGGI